MYIYFYQAECGDAARINFLGTDGKTHNIFIDSGFERTFRYVLLKEIQNIINEDERIDLWIVSHIHEDHIGGIIAYLKAIGNGEVKDIVNKWYYNSPRLLMANVAIQNQSEISSASSIQQGDRLYEYLIERNKETLTDITTDLSIQDLFGLKLSILSPTQLKLQELRSKYLLTPNKLFEEEELSSISIAVSVRENDYHKLVEEFKLEDWNEDNNIENGSSIAFLTELDDKKILWLADSHPSVVILSLQKMGYSVDNPLICDWVKVIHHGSKFNNSKELYQIIRCSNYLISANGENKYYLPAKESIVRILCNPLRPLFIHYNFYFTYDNVTLRSMFNTDGDDVFKKLNFTMHYQNKKSILINLN